MKKNILIFISLIVLVILVFTSVFTIKYFINSKNIKNDLFVVNFMDYNGTILKEEKVAKNKSATAPSVSSRTGYDFISWNKEFNNVTSDLIIIAQYKVHEHQYQNGECSCGDVEINENTYTVKFLDYDGTVLKEEKVEISKSATAPSVSSRTGYDFIGWSKEFNNVTSDLIIIAQYKVHEHVFIDFVCECGVNKEKFYVVVFKNYDGTILDEQTVSEYGHVSAPDVPDREGYNFVGWDKDYHNINENTILVAQFSSKEFVVSFDSDGGTLIDSQNVKYDACASIPNAPLKDGYIFGGWQLNNNDYDFATPITKNITLKAIWLDSPLNFMLSESETEYSVKGKTNCVKIIIPSTYNSMLITTIEDLAFTSFNKLNSIEIPNTISYIGENAFNYCNSLVNVYYNGTIEEWFNITFENTASNPMYYAEHFFILNNNNEYYEVTELKIPDHITKLSIEMFGFENVTKIYIPAGVTNIENFGVYSNLKDVYYNGTVEDWTNIQFSSSSFNPMYYAEHFYMIDIHRNYYEVTEIEIPDTVTSIGNYQFYGFDNITKVIIPDSVTSIGEYAFFECNSLNSITIPFVGDALENPVYTNFGYLFGTRQYSYNGEYVPETLKEVIITGGTSIDRYAFYNCNNLNIIELPNEIMKIGSNAFYGCDNLSLNKYDGANYLGNIDNPYLALISINDNKITEFIIQNDTKVIMSEAFEDFEYLKTVDIPYTLLFIGESAFSNCHSLESIELPATIKFIDNYAFYCCDNLDKVYFSGDLENWCNIEFYNASSNPMYYGDYFYMLNEEREWQEVNEIVIPHAVSSIGQYQFYGFSGLSKIDLPSTIVTIEVSAFEECSSLKSITIPDATTSIESSAFKNCVNLARIQFENGLEYIGDRAFYNCTSLESIYFPASLTKVGTEILKNCVSLATLTTPELYDGYLGDFFGKVHTGYSYVYDVPASLYDVTIYNCSDIISEAFIDCYSIGTITLTNSIQTIYADAFKDCNSLEEVYFDGTIEDWCNIEFINSYSNPMSQASKFLIKNVDYGYDVISQIVIPESIIKINDYQFYNIDSLYNVVLHKDIISIGDYAFCNCENLYIIEFPDSITYIGEGAFSNCDSLTNLEIPENVTTINDYAFNNCDNLTNLKILGNVTCIGEYAFYRCEKLMNFDIPDTVLSIGEYAFYGCDALTKIFIPNSVVTMGYYAFGYCDNLTINCEVCSRPSGWNSWWASSCKEIVWDYN